MEQLVEVENCSNLPAKVEERGDELVVRRKGLALSSRFVRCVLLIH